MSIRCIRDWSARESASGEVISSWQDMCPQQFMECHPNSSSHNIHISKELHSVSTPHCMMYNVTGTSWDDIRVMRPNQSRCDTHNDTHIVCQ